MKVLSKNDLEQIASRVWKAYQKLPQFQNELITRVNPLTLVTDVLGLDIQYHHLSKQGNILGVTAPCEIVYQAFTEDYEQKDVPLDGKTILIEKDLKEDIRQKGRCHFTIAHEASHQIFKMLYPKEYEIGSKHPKFRYYLSDSEYRKPITDWEEWQANTLGALLLMPEEIVRQAMRLLNLPGKIKTLNKIFYPKIYERFMDMANFLGVSGKALSIRLRQLGLLENDYYEHPDTAADIWKI